MGKTVIISGERSEYLGRDHKGLCSRVHLCDYIQESEIRLFYHRETLLQELGCFPTHPLPRRPEASKKDGTGTKTPPPA